MIALNVFKEMNMKLQKLLRYTKGRRRGDFRTLKKIKRTSTYFMSLTLLEQIKLTENRVIL